MKKAILTAILGLAIGYSSGYADGAGGRAHLARRVMDGFGMSKIKAAQDAREKRADDAGKD